MLPRTQYAEQWQAITNTNNVSLRVTGFDRRGAEAKSILVTPPLHPMQLLQALVEMIMENLIFLAKRLVYIEIGQLCRIIQILPHLNM